MLATCRQRQTVTAVPDRAVEELEDYVRVTVKERREDRIWKVPGSFSIMNSYLSRVDLEASELIIGYD
jgi:hypothetical protein